MESREAAADLLGGLKQKSQRLLCLKGGKKKTRKAESRKTFLKKGS